VAYHLGVKSNGVVIGDDGIDCGGAQCRLLTIETLLMFHIAKVAKTPASKAFPRISYQQKGGEFLDSLTVWLCVVRGN